MFQTGRIADMSNQASWQSLFWALTPIALNSMCQPCGKVLGLPSRCGFYLNSSPIICVVNAFELVLKLLWRSCSMRSVEAAASLTANEIFEDIESPGRQDGLTQLQEMWTVRLLVFVFGAVPQFIKLYAITGIPGTQACTSLYLGSFLAIELIMVYLRRYRSSSQPRRPSTRRGHFEPYEFLRTFAFFTTISISSVAFVEAAFKPLARSDVSYAGILVNWAGAGYVSLPWCYSYESGRRALMGSMYSVFYLYLLMFVSLGGLVCATPGKWATIENFDAPPIALLQDWEKGPARAIFLDMPVYYVALMLFLLWSTHSLGTRRAFRTRPTVQHCASIAFMVLHFLAAILPYALEYDPQGTYKPDWTNQLG